MAAMPHAHPMEQVLESLGAVKSVSASSELQPQWRLVSRDGSTSSVGGPPEKKLDCPDCLAGRCGQNPQGCHCSTANAKPTISLDRLTGIQSALAPATPPAGPTNAAMPQAKPQLFEQASPHSKPANDQDDGDWEYEVFRAPATPRSERTLLASTSAQGTASEQNRATTSSASLPIDNELQQVIDHWPRLSQSTRRAILALVGALDEADSA